MCRQRRRPGWPGRVGKPSSLSAAVHHPSPSTRALSCADMATRQASTAAGCHPGRGDRITATTTSACSVMRAASRGRCPTSRSTETAARRSIAVPPPTTAVVSAHAPAAIAAAAYGCGVGGADAAYRIDVSSLTRSASNRSTARSRPSSVSGFFNDRHISGQRASGSPPPILRFAARRTCGRLRHRLAHASADRAASCNRPSIGSPCRCGGSWSLSMGQLCGGDGCPVAGRAASSTCAALRQWWGGRRR